MPLYDYKCAQNGRVIEVNHKRSETIKTWAQLCDRTGTDPGDTDPDAPVERLITGGSFFIHSSNSPAENNCACGRGGCGMQD